MSENLQSYDIDINISSFESKMKKVATISAKLNKG